MANKNVLGKGLESLFDQNVTASYDENLVMDILIEDIEPNPFQPRKTFDQEALDELAISIKNQGVFQPILVRKAIIGYEIISGERRYRASKIAGLLSIPAIVYDYDDNQMMEVGIIENIQREDLNIIEEARSYQMLIDNLNLTQNQVSERVGKSRSYIANMLRVLTLEERVLDLVADGTLTLGHVKVLVGIEDQERIWTIANTAVRDNLTVRQVEELAKTEKVTTTSTTSSTSSSSVPNEYLRLERIMREKLDAQVKITGKNSGKLAIDFQSREDLERILDILKLF